MMTAPAVWHLLNQALQPRLPRLDEEHISAMRLFNGFFEGLPDLTVDLFASTLVLTHYARQPEMDTPLLPQAMDFYRSCLPWLQAILIKTRHAADPAERRGRLAWGSAPADRIREDATWYALDLQLNQDASFYLDTRLLRQWIKEHASGQGVLNTFAYTGSLGIAALAGGAASVLQTDLNPRFLELARRSASLNAFPGSQSLHSGDFFRIAGGLRNQDARFELVILDAPFFSRTEAGQVDLLNHSTRLINKIRPLVAQNGRLIAINNALFLSGEAYLASLKRLCADGYLEIEALLPVPQDFIGYAQYIQSALPADPAPFNHPTKIAVLRVTHRQP